MDSPHFPLNVWFRLSPKFRVWYAAVALLVVLLVIVVYAPVVLLADVPFLVTITVAALTVVVLALFLDAGDPGFWITPVFPHQHAAGLFISGNAVQISPNYHGN